MNISGLDRLADLFERLQSRGRGNGQSGGRIEELLERARERREARRSRREERGEAPESPIAPPTSEAPSTPVTTPSNEETSIEDLAELYVKQYEEGSGNKLSEEEFKEKTAEVAEFYSGLSNGRERLDKVVFGNDEPISIA